MHYPVLIMLQINRLHHIYCARKNASWIIELETMPLVITIQTALISEEKLFSKYFPTSCCNGCMLLLYIILLTLS